MGGIPVECLVPAESEIRSTIEELIDRHQAELIGVAVSLCGDRGLAEDAVQEGFIALVDQWRKGIVIRDRTAWLFQVVRHRARDRRRKEVRVHRREAAVATPDRGAAPADPLEHAERRGAIAQLLTELEPPLREVIELSVIGGKSYREVAALTGVSLGTVANRVHQGLSRIAGGLRGAGLL